MVTELRNRYIELDVLRGLAVCLMVVYHFVWNLYVWDVWMWLVDYPIFWQLWQMLTGVLFLVLVGVGLSIGVMREKPYVMVLRRAGWLLACGYGLSLGGWMFGLGRIDFGILQLIGVSMLLTYPLMRWLWVRMGIAVVCLRWGVVTPWPAAVGIQLDYYPLIPWWGVVLMGSVIGTLLYRSDGLRLGLKWPVMRLNRLEWMGRHALLIYLLHQPFMWALWFVWSVGISPIDGGL